MPVEVDRCEQAVACRAAKGAGASCFSHTFDSEEGEAASILLGIVQAQRHSSCKQDALDCPANQVLHRFKVPLLTQREQAR